MAGKNDITGDRLINKVLTKEGEENWDKIFGKQIPKEDPVKKPFPHTILKQPHNKGLHYVLDDGQLTDEQYAKIKQQLSEYELDKSTGEVIKKENNNG